MEIPQALVEAAANRTLVPFVGAGISRNANPDLPTWKELIEYLFQAAISSDSLIRDEQKELKELIGHGEYRQVAEFLKMVMPDDVFRELLNQRFDANESQPGAVHRGLFRLKPTLIITTNYDCMLEEPYVEMFHSYPRVITPEYPDGVAMALKGSPRNSQVTSIFKVHGTIHDPRSLVLTESDYHRLAFQNPSYKRLLSIIFMTKTVLMLGFSFSDPDLIEILASSFPIKGNPHFIACPKGEKLRIEKRRLRNVFGLEVIEYDPSKDELLELIDQLGSSLS
jgi:hypothetical protein